MKKSKIYGIELKDGEEIIKIVRHHWIDFARSVFYSLLILFIAFFIFFQYLKSGKADIENINLQAAFAVLFNFNNFFSLIFWILFAAALIYFFSSLHIFRTNSLIITNFRIIDNKVKGLFSKIVSDVYYDDIFDVLCTIKGFWPTILGYGNIIIKTQKKKVVFKKIRQPQKIKELITFSSY